MPNAWVHAAIDLIAYGRPYFDIHKEKDKPSEILRQRHRKIKHEWYQVFGKKWTFDSPFPNFLKDQILKINQTKGGDKAEEVMAYTDHDYIDKIWDELPKHERKYWEGFFAWVLLNPKILKNWAGVDVSDGKIKRIINDHEVWETCSVLKTEYKRLCNYVKIVIKNDKNLHNMLECNTMAN